MILFYQGVEGGIYECFKSLTRGKGISIALQRVVIPLKSNFFQTILYVCNEADGKPVHSSV